MVRTQGATAQLGVSASTLKLYERRGLIPPAVRNRASQRVYAPADLERIGQVVVPAREVSGG